MLIFLANGRLGNQIFQYVFLRTIQKNNEMIITSGFEDLLEVFEIDDVVNLNKKDRMVSFFLDRICKSILTFFSDKKFISSIVVNHEEVLNNYKRELTNYKSIHGFFNKITFIRAGYFQSESFFDKRIANQLKIKAKYLEETIRILSDIPKKNYTIFVHIRRRDYKKHTVYGQSALLPISYYKEQIDFFSQNKKAFFIFLSDEPKLIDQEFGYIKNKIISNDHHFGTDLAIMTQCKSAILSPSSFGWWGSYMMKQRDIVIVPKYWLGFNSNIEHPEKSTPSYSKKVDI